ncbi:unnamed protein product, partial [Prorocentrum cordatum]
VSLPKSPQHSSQEAAAAAPGGRRAPAELPAGCRGALGCLGGCLAGVRLGVAAAAPAGA